MPHLKRLPSREAGKGTCAIREPKGHIITAPGHIVQRAKGICGEGSERIIEVNKEVEALGVKIVAQYALLGPYDMEMGGRGTLRTMTMTICAMSVDDFVKGIGGSNE